MISEKYPIRCQNGSQINFAGRGMQANQRSHVTQTHASYPECHRFESYLSHTRKPLCYTMHRGFSYVPAQVQKHTKTYIYIHGLVVKTVVKTTKKLFERIPQSFCFCLVPFVRYGIIDGQDHFCVCVTHPRNHGVDFNRRFH